MIALCITLPVSSPVKGGFRTLSPVVQAFFQPVDGLERPSHREGRVRGVK